MNEWTRAAIAGLLRRLLGALGAISRCGPTRPSSHAARAQQSGVLCARERSVTDLAVLQDACVQLKLPRPRKRLLRRAKDLRSFFYLSRPRGFWDERLDRRPPPQLQQMIEAVAADPQLDIELVPVAVYWGRAPQKERSWFRLLFVEDWAITSRARKFMQVLFNGRNTLIEFDEPISLRACSARSRRGRARAAGHARVARSVREAARGAHRAGPFAPPHHSSTASCARARCEPWWRRRCARRRSRAARRCCRRSTTRRKSPRTTRMPSCASWSSLTRLWNRLYDGVEFGHVETLEQAAEGNEIIYVPCHRSHMDYLLLSYAILRARLCDSAHRRRHQPEPADRRALPAQGRGVLHSPQLPRQCVVHRRLHEVSRGHHGARAFDRVFHRRRPQPHRPAAAAEDRHARR